jgi:D-sedoheptulose 7-phosphate isomerase
MDWNQIAEQALAVTHEVLSEMRPAIEALAVELARRVESGGTILICGNGGSAGDAQHFAGELVNRFLFDRRPYAGVALTTDTSVITAIGNDFGYDQIFSKQVEAIGREGDALVAISTSGNAANVLHAIAAAKARGLLTVGMTGGYGGKLAGSVDACLSVSCTDSTPRIQEGHGLIIHLLCERIEEILR